MKYIILFLILFSTFACGNQNTANKKVGQKLPEMVAYVNNPRPNDSLCMADIERAKKDIQQGGLVFTINSLLPSREKRFEEELKDYCQKLGLHFTYTSEHCVVIPNNTSWCYEAYMDKVIYEKFGANFKRELLRKADSLFLQNVKAYNLVVDYWDCDERPRLPQETQRDYEGLPDIKVSGLAIKESTGMFGDWPFFDINFIIAKDSTISTFQTDNFVEADPANKPLKDTLFALAVDHIKKNYPKWVPGKIKGMPVKTRNNVRISIVKEDK